MQRYLLLSALWLLFNHSTYAVAQTGSATLDNLPQCSVTCANEAAVAVGCRSNNASCLCSQESFITAAIQCSFATCAEDDLSVTENILSKLCLNDISTTTSTTTTSSTAHQLTLPTAGSTTSTSKSSTSRSSSTSTTSSTTTPTLPISAFQVTTPASSTSTVVIVQTIMLPQPSTTASAAGRSHIQSISMGTRALTAFIIGLIFVVAAIELC